MAIQFLGTLISGLASDTKPTLTAGEKGSLFVETDTNKIYQWDVDSWNQTAAAHTGDFGSDAITTTGLISGGSLDVDDVLIDGSNIGHTNDTDLITVSNGLVTVAGEVSATTLDIGGTNITSTAAELNSLDGLSRGSILYGNASAATTVLTKGNANQVLTSDGTDIAWQDSGGGGSLEFVSKTTISSNTTYIDLTGLDYDTVYKLIIKRLEFTGYSYRSLYIQSFINGGGSVAGAVHDGSFQHLGGHQSGNSQSGWDFYQYGGENEHVTGTLEFYTGYYGYIRGMAHHVGLSNGVRYSEVSGTLNNANHATSRISGLRITNTNFQDWVSGQVLLYKYKES